MKATRKLDIRPIAASVALLLTVLGGARPAMADDTEIFLNRPSLSSDVPPNVLFVLDTSFSMKTDVEIPGEDGVPAVYDKATPYPVGSSGCVAGRIYWRGTNPSVAPPADCAGLPSVSATNFTCDYLQKDIDSSGRVYGNFSVVGANSTKVAQATKFNSWSNSDKWEKLTAIALTGNAERYIECELDAGVHGQASSASPYAANGTKGPWSATAGDKINWNSLGGEFDFFDGNYLNFYHRAPKTTMTRMDILIDSLDSVIQWLEDRDINLAIGLMRYSNNGAQDTDGAGDGGMVIHPVLPIRSTTSWYTCPGTPPATVAGTVADSLQYTLTERLVTNDANDGVPQSCTDVRVMKPDGPTPMGETLYESYHYWLGELVDYGNRSRLNPGVELKSVVGSRRSPAGMGQGDVYKSPITEACGKNYTILFSDGSTNQDRSADQQIVNTIATEKGKDAKCDAEFDPNDDSRPSDCVDDLAGFMFRNDLSNLSGLQNVTTYTVGFDLLNNDDDPLGTKATTLLKDTATRGGGRFYLADSADSLVAVFTQIIREILVENVSFAAPTVTVNAFNRTQNLNELFMTVFRPSSSERWKGNLKKYRIGESGDIFGQDPDFIAVDPATGFFRDGSQSYWSNEVDGSDVTKGGAAAEMPTPGANCTSSGNRKLYTNIADDDLNGTADNCVTATNATLVSYLLAEGVATDAAAAEKLLSWARGTDVDDLDEDGDMTDSRLDMGDPLHSRPVSIIYGGDAASPDGVVYAATNDGVLHAFNPGPPDNVADNLPVPAAGGNELWSFIPKELLVRLGDLYTNDARSTPDKPRSYGLDGSIRAYKTDADGDGAVEGSDVVYLFFGMRAGGNLLYGMDVTNKSNPQVMWTLGPDELPGIGETWSTPVVSKVKIGNDIKLVVVVGGGYDPRQESYDGATDTFDFRYKDDVVGNRIFIIDAENGNLLWSAGPSGATLNLAKMTSGFASDLRVIDLSADGLADRIYASDIGGRVWRFDIWNGSSASNLVTGGVIASLGEADGGSPYTESESRRFYYGPDPALVTGCGPAFINVAIGSGNRAWPNSDTVVQNRFYSIRDYNTYGRLTQDQYDDLDPVEDGDLYLVNSDFALNDISPNVPTNAKGWRLELRDDNSWIGEKILAESRTFANKVFFPSYTPVERETSDACAPKYGLNKLYVVNACNAAPVINWEDQTQPPDSVTDISKELAQGSIAPEVTFVFPSPEDAACVGRDCAPPPICLIGLESCGTGVANRPVRTYWLQRERP